TSTSPQAHAAGSFSAPTRMGRPSTTRYPSFTATSWPKRPRTESYFSKCASCRGSSRSFTATTWVSVRAIAARNAIRPMRPNPLMPIVIMVDSLLASGIPPHRPGSNDRYIAFSATRVRLGPMRSKTKHTWFLVSPRAGILNVAGPWEVLGHANDILGREAYALAAFGPVAPAMRTRHGLLLAGLRPLPKRFDCAPDIVIVAGGSPLSPLPPEHAAIVAWLRRHHERIPTLVSICVGAFLLGEAGLLDGRRATTHWEFIHELQARFPAARVCDEGIHVRDGRIWTSAGLTAGIDLALALVEEDHGHAVAMAVAKRMVLFLRRSGNQAQFSEPLRRQEKEPP